MMDYVGQSMTNDKFLGMQVQQGTCNSAMTLRLSKLNSKWVRFNQGLKEIWIRQPIAAQAILDEAFDVEEEWTDWLNWLIGWLGWMG